MFAEAHNGDLRLIFRYSIDSQRPVSLPSKVVNAFHDIETEDPGETFPDRRAMRKEIWSSIHQVWEQCIAHPNIRASDAIVEMKEDPTGLVRSRVHHEPTMYQGYKASLLPLSQLLPGEDSRVQACTIIEYSNLDRLNHLPGRGTSTVVRLPSIADSLFVYKGIDFTTYLDSPTNFPQRRDMFYHEIKTVWSLPGHPNIITPPQTLVVIGNVDDPREALLCGTLYPFLENGSLEDSMKAAKESGVRIDIKNKMKWCYQMVSAILHTHRVAHTYHMDIKPGNMLLDSRKDLILCDWEQYGAPLYTLAPEADGSWDVELEHSKAANEEP